MKTVQTRVILVMAALLMTILTGSPAGAATAPTLGTAGSFAVLGATTVTNTGPTLIDGELGVSPGSAVTGFPPGIVTPATIHSADAEAGQAQNNLTTAYNFLAGQVCEHDLTGQDLGVLPTPLVPGTYCLSSSAQLTGALTLNAQGNPDSVFVFQIGSTLSTASNSSVGFINGATCNVYWQIGSSATLGTGTDFQGNILALTSITANTGATVDGRLLARNGAVTLDSNRISRPVCGTPVADSTPTPTPTPTQSSTPAPTPTPTPTVVGPETVIPPGTVVTPDQIILPAVPGATSTTTAPPTSSANPSEVGETIMLTTGVTSNGSGPVPSGLVTFLDGSTVIGTVPLNDLGVATLTASFLTQGDHPITAVYRGAPGFSGSFSRSLTQRVEQAPGITVAITRQELVKTGINALPFALTGSASILLGIGLLLEDRRRSKAAVISIMR
jgi:ice-binding like protein/Big-like domain-containing protein